MVDSGQVLYDMKIKNLVTIGWFFILLISAHHVLFSQTREDCLTCHSDQSLSKESDGKQVSLFVDENILNHSPHKKLVCVACHTKFDPNNVPHKEKITEINCLTCHQSAPVKHPFHPQLAEAIKNKQTPDVGCKDCHGTHNVISPKVPDSKFSKTKLTESCGECHSDVTEHFSLSAHGKAAAAGVSGAPNCIRCHQNNIIGVNGERDSIEFKVAQEKLCLSCHLDDANVRANISPSAGFIAAYEKSVHGAALKRGNAKAATCIDCHGSHDMKVGLDPSATVNKMHLAETCSKCHGDVAKAFGESVHGMALLKGVEDAPACTNCHGEHNILKHTDPNSPVATKNLSQQVCSPCHSSLKLSAKYGLSTNRFQTFSDSYHGLALQGGSVGVANCASCHGSHNIKPSSDSTSTIFKANLATTCGKCHPGANERFAVGSVHVTEAKADEPILYWIATGYIILIFTTIGGMFVHNGIDFVKKSKRKLMIRRGLIEEEHHGHALYLRMTENERLQHVALVLSFFLLVITGFMLRFPDAWWVQAIRSISDDVFAARSWIHRIAAVIMTLASLYHIYYIAFTKRGREVVKDLFPKLQDAYDAIGIMKYNLNLSPIKPKLGRFSYVEKAEYWALVWGTMVMAATGFVMWFDNTFIGIFTKLGYDISRTIHYYEAWLATLAIIVWHFYFVIFNPETYPINLAFWKGTLTESEMLEEHPLELEEIKRKQMLEELAENDGNGKGTIEDGQLIKQKNEKDVHG
ncbi:MAG: cytochrome b/b6 domain-containing protein [Ignavibacteriales bacterium]|nr:cytochrome b/b6 domain-containing protein [Ignavibacteriales bacterium]